MSSWISFSYNIYNITVIIAGIMAVAFAVGIYRCKSLMYSVYLLAGLGFSIAALVALLGFQVIGAVHVIIYVGAAVLFFIITLSMMGDMKTGLYDTKFMTPFGIILFLLVYYSLRIVVDNISYQPGPTVLQGFAISRYLVQEYLPQLFIAVFAMAATVVESLVIARKELLGDKR